MMAMMTMMMMMTMMTMMMMTKDVEKDGSKIDQYFGKIKCNRKKKTH